MNFEPHAQTDPELPVWRALQDMPVGFYIDAGALDAEAGFMTAALYERGWSGVSVAPSPDVAMRLAAARPRDVILIRDEAGTLAEICRAHAHGAVHLLRIDAGGAEPAVLRGMDFAACRPWIAMVRAAAPSERALWEPMLLAAGYGLVWFDGRDRYYLSEERRGMLAPASATPLQESGGGRGVEPRLARRLAQAEAEAALAVARAHGGAERLLDATRAIGALRSVAAERADTVLWQRSLLSEAAALEQRLRADGDWVRGQLEDQRRIIEEHRNQLLARAEEVAWLHGCLKDSAIALEATRRDRDHLERRALHAEALIPVKQERFPRLRRLTGLFRAPPASPAWVEPEAVAPPPALPLPLPPPDSHPAIVEPPPLPRPEPEHEPTPEPSPEPAPAPAPEALPHPVRALAGPARHLVHAVHQFHPDCAVGDAITNAMLALRGVLRGLGYDSDIFAERRPEALAGEVQTLDTMPRHDGYVLLAHHSMGYPGFAAIAALPARKVLVYHNITPPDYLGQVARLQDRARLGREQLLSWRDHAVAAVALSEYTAIELRRAGFESVQSCNLLFDLASLRRRAADAQAERRARPFTILFVGRIAAAKAQDDLVAAYAEFCTRYEAASQLVMVGAFDAEDVAYLDRLNDLILEHGLADQVLMPGLVSDAELDSWYARAHLYVSLSRHEGFGVPLVEAMVHGIPVLAWPAGAVPYTLDGASPLLAGRDPVSVAEQMLALAHDPAQCAAIVARQAASLPRFDLPRQIPVLQEALALAGAQSRPGAAAHAALAANVQLAVMGHVNKTYSLAAVNRAIAAVFDARRPGAARLVPVEGEPTAFQGEVPQEARALVAGLVGRAPAPTGPVVVLSQHFPVYVPPDRGDLTLAMVAWEETLLPPATVQTLNEGFDAVLAPSSFVSRVLVDSGVSRPVITMGEAPPLRDFTTIGGRAARTPFTFLHVSSGFPRKGLDALLAAWRQAFRASDAVRLVVKSFPNPNNDAAAQIERLRAADGGAAPVELIDQDLNEADLAALFAAADAMVLPTRGEGFNLPAAEAMAAGLPLIVTDCGGHRDFCGPGTARLVRSRPALSASHLATPFSLWREPDVPDLADALRDAVHGAPPGQVAAARAAIAAACDPAAFVDRLAEVSATLILAGPAPPARLAWITSWSVRCGVAEYARALVDAMPADGVARLAILCDDRTPGDGDIVQPCWSRDPAHGTDALVAAVLREDADVVMVQHQPGLLAWSALAGLLRALAVKDQAVVVTLHNTAHLLTVDAEERTAAVTALAGIARILVHTLTDLDRLEALGLRGSLLPHGAPTAAPPCAARALPPGSDPVVGCYGFFLPGKGIGALIEAVAALRAQWPAIRLRLVNAEYGHDSSAAEIAACRAAAEACGLAVEWHLEYLPEAQARRLLAGCDLVVLPYEPSSEGSSAAVRSALASGAPVAVTPIALFDEVGAAAARLPGGDAGALADGLAGLLADADHRAALSAAACQWLGERAVPDIARRLHGMQLGLAAQRRLGLPLDGATWSPRR